MKIGYILSHPIQYFSPMLRLLASTPDIELIVYYGHDPSQFKQVDKGFGKVIEWDTPLLEGYSSVFLKNWVRPASLDNQFFSLVNPSIINALRKDKPEIVIVHGWSYLTNWLAIISACLLGKKVWLRGENPFNQEIKKPKWLIACKRILLQFGLFKMIDRFLYIGTENKKFYRFYGVRDDKLIYCPYAVDNSFFQEKAKKMKGLRAVLKEKYGVTPDSIVILFCGKYISKKRPMDLLGAFAKLNRTSAFLIMVGEGELRTGMENFIYEYNVKNVVLSGFVNQEEISNYYALADIFVLPSGVGETWGLVANEAMNFQLPLVVSATVGSATDLVLEGDNGFVYEEGNIEELTKCIQVLIDDENLRESAGLSSLRRIEKFGYHAMVDNIVQEIGVLKRRSENVNA